MITNNHSQVIIFLLGLFLLVMIWLPLSYKITGCEVSDGTMVRSSISLECMQ